MGTKEILYQGRRNRLHRYTFIIDTICNDDDLFISDLHRYLRKITDRMKDLDSRNAKEIREDVRVRTIDNIIDILKKMI